MEIPKVYAENIFLQKLNIAVTKVKLRFNKFLRYAFTNCHNRHNTPLQKLEYALEKSTIPETYAS